MKVRIMSKLEAIQHSFKSEIAPCLIISINCPSEGRSPHFDKNPNIIDIKTVLFDDLEPHQVEGLDDYKLMSNEDAEGIISFINSYKQDFNIGTIKEIIVHCHAGISRSSAVASCICRYLDLDDMWIWSEGDYMPNRHVIDTMNLYLNGKVFSNEEIERRYAINEAWRDVDIFGFNNQIEAMSIKPYKKEE